MFATSATVIQSNTSGRSFSLPLMYLHQWRSPPSVCNSSPSCPSVPGESLVPELCPPWWQRSDQLFLSSSDGERSPVGSGSDTRPGLAGPDSDRNMYHHLVPPDCIRGSRQAEQIMSFIGVVHPEMLATNCLLIISLWFFTQQGIVGASQEGNSSVLLNKNSKSSP